MNRINDTIQLLLLFFTLIFSFSLSKGRLLEPCSDLTKIPPLCKYGPPRKIEKTLGMFGGETTIIDSIANHVEQHYILMQVPQSGENSSQLLIQGYTRSESTFESFFPMRVIKDDCGGAFIQGESIRFINSSSNYLLVSGWFNAVNPVCIGSFSVSTVTTSSARKVPFMAILSDSAKVLYVNQFENDFTDYTLSGFDIDISTGFLYALMQKGEDLMLGVYNNSQLMYKKQFGRCNTPSTCKVLGLHYSKVYERVVISIFESEQGNLFIDGDTRSYSIYGSAMWSILLLPKNGSHISTHRLFYSRSAMQLPKIKFNSIGTMTILLTCEKECYSNDLVAEPGMFLLQFDYIKTIFPFSKNFILTNSTFKPFKIYSLSLERDLTINVVFSGFNGSYTIRGDQDRNITASPFTVYLCKFRNSDGNIINVLPMNTNSNNEVNNFILSTSNSIVNTNRKVTEQVPILFLTKPKNTLTRDLTLTVYSYMYSGNRYNFEYEYVSSSAVHGHYADYLTTSSTNGKTAYIKFCYSRYYDRKRYLLSLVIGSDSGSVAKATSCENEETINLSEDEYFLQFYSQFGYFNNQPSLNCISFVTNKRTISFSDCVNGNEPIPSNMDIVGFELSGYSYLNSITYKYGYLVTYSCASGWTGDNCDIPTCYGIETSNANICNGNGECVGPNTCTCSKHVEPSDSHNCLSYGFYCHESYSPYFTHTCSGVGTCLLNSSCDCERGYYGSDCEIEAQCFGFTKNSKDGCSGHGKCLDTDICKCDTGYTGSSCETPICFGKSANDSRVCTGHGSCTGYDSCICNEHYYGPNCSRFGCNGTDSTLSTSCSGKGICIDYNNCSCSKGYFGANCEHFTCNGTHHLNASVCIGRGVCSSLDSCICNTHSYGKMCESCKASYYGDKCEKWNCGGFEQSDPLVCSGGRGICERPETCICNPHSYGNSCETCKNDHFGELCDVWTCDGKLNTEASVCNYRGICSDYNNCSCIRSNGTFCENCLEYFTGQSCSKCLDGRHGADCYNYLESETIQYNDNMGKDWVGFTLYTHTNMKYKYDDNSFTECTNIVQDNNKLTSDNSINSLKCRVQYQSTSPDGTYRYRLEIWAYKYRAIFTIQEPILFNVMYASTARVPNTVDPIYIPIHVDISDFTQKYKYNYNGGSLFVKNARKYSTELNRCYENVISISFFQPEHGPVRSIKWELVGESSKLMNNSIVASVIATAQNKLEWTLPYFSEILTLTRLELRFSVVTNFNLTFSTTGEFKVGGSFPKQFINTPFNRRLTSSELEIPISTFFPPENHECIDGTTMRGDIDHPEADVLVKLSKDTITIKVRMFAAHPRITLMFYDYSMIPLRLNLQDPTVFIRESIVSSANPILTVECFNSYGKDLKGNVDFIWIMENRIAYKSAIYTGPVQIDARTLRSNFDTSSSHTFSVACVRSSQYAHVDLQTLAILYSYPFSEYIVIGKSTKTISFSSSWVERSGCKVVSASLKTRTPNVIPFTDSSLSIFLEVVTTNASTCKIDISIDDNESKHFLESVSGTNTTYLIPLKYFFNSLSSSSNEVRLSQDYFQFSIIGSGDVSDYSFVTYVQKSPFYLFDVSCSMWPEVLEIGFTNAQFNCNIIGNSMSSFKTTLLMDGVSLGNSLNVFTIQFKPTKPSVRFEILFTDDLTGGKYTMKLHPTNSVEYSYNSLLSSDSISSIVSSISETKGNDYHNKNDLMILLVSNINLVMNETVLSEISKMVPLALTATTSSITSQLETTLSQGSITSSDMSRYINQVKVLSKPQFLNQDTTTKTVDILHKLLDASKKSSVWSSDSTSSLSEILLNVASKISEASTIKTSNAIVNAAISLGSRTELTTTDFFPNEKPSNLVMISAIKVLAGSLKEFSFKNSVTPLLSFHTSASPDTIVKVSNSLFEFPSSVSRGSTTESKRDYISQISLTTMGGTLHVNVPLPSATYPSSSYSKPTFSCSITLDFVKFESETYCKVSKTFLTIVPDIKPSPQQILMVDCICDLSLLTSLTTSDVIGITAEYIYIEEKTIDNGNNLNGDKDGDGNDGSGAAAIILIPIFIFCFCFIAIPSTVVYILVRELKKREIKSASSSSNGTTNQQPPYARVVTSSSIATSNLSENVTPQNVPYSVEMRTLSFSVNEEPTAPTTI